MNFEKKNNIYKIIMLVLITVTITFMITTLFIHNQYKNKSLEFFKELANEANNDEIENEEIVNNNLNTKIQLVQSYLDKYYLEETDKEKCIESAIKGYVSGTGDIYTEYLTEEEYQELMTDVNGNYMGIGIYMAQDREENVVILTTIENSPAEEAKLQSGDIILKINDEECKGQDLTLVANKIKGEEGTKVKLEIQRGEEIITKSIVRKKVEINAIKSEVLENNIRIHKNFSI